MSQDKYSEIQVVLERERERLGSVNPQFSFYQRIAATFNVAFHVNSRHEVH
jgi:hypothetical protein